MNIIKSENVIKYDFIVIGAGIAGASAAYKLSQYGKVVLLEREEIAGYHTTGRSAAFFTENYGNKTVRSLTKASRKFYETPPLCFGSEKLLIESGGSLFISNKKQNEAIEKELEYAKYTKSIVFEIPSSEAIKKVPILKKEYIHRALIEPDAKGLDVDLIHQGYIRGFKENKGQIIFNSEVIRISNKRSKWTVYTKAGNFESNYLINAAGAWGDIIGKMANCKTLGLMPKRRTVIIFNNNTNLEISNWPVVIDIEDKFYFKPEAGKILASPADETNSPPCDAQPEDIDIALTVDRIEKATNFEIKKIDHKWAGLRSFLPNRTPAAFEDTTQKGFFWLLGQGGYGIQTAPAISEIIECLIAGKEWPKYLKNRSIFPNTLNPTK